MAESLIVSRQSLSAWQRIYNDEGVDGLLTNKGDLKRQESFKKGALSSR